MPTANMIQGSLLQLSGTLTGHIAPKVGAASHFATFVIPSPLSSVCTARSSVDYLWPRPQPMMMPTAWQTAMTMATAMAMQMADDCGYASAHAHAHAHVYAKAHANTSA